MADDRAAGAGLSDRIDRRRCSSLPLTGEGRYGTLVAGVCAAGLASTGLFFFTLSMLIERLRG